MKKGMSVIFGFALLMSGCAAVQFNPKPQGQQLVVTKVTDTPAQLIVARDFQQKSVHVDPVGKKWQSVNLDVFAGKAVTKSMSSYLSASLPDIRIGDVDDGRFSVVKLEPTIAALEIGTDDTATYHTSMFIPLAQFAMTADVVSSITLAARAHFCDGSEQTFTATGKALRNQNYAGIGFPDMEEISGLAIDDASGQIAQQVVSRVRQIDRTSSSCR